MKKRENRTLVFEQPDNPDHFYFINPNDWVQYENPVDRERIKAAWESPTMEVDGNVVRITYPIPQIPFVKIR